MFSVPCGSQLQLFRARSGVCDLADTAVADPLCPGNEIVIVHASGITNTRMHFIESGAVQTVQLLHCDCIYMQQGVFWIDTAVHAQAPREREIEMLLRQSEEISEQSSLRLQRLALPILSSCPREHHVLTLTPRQDMRLELLFQRNYVESSVRVAVGVDDIQLAPVLSDFYTGAQGGHPVHSRKRCARLIIHSLQHPSFTLSGTQHAQKTLRARSIHTVCTDSVAPSRPTPRTL